jgi:hypothetical protein
MDSAPGEPILTPVDEIKSPLEIERAEYFSTYNCAYNSTLPWQEPYNYSNINKSEEIDLDKLIVENTKVHMLYYINWDKIALDLNKELNDNLQSWGNFWSLIDNWNGSLLELAQASNSLS